MTQRRRTGMLVVSAKLSGDTAARLPLGIGVRIV